jgi:hypothetical protein
MENSTEIRSVNVGSDDGRDEHLEHALKEHCVLKQAINLWQGPKYPGYFSIIERVRSFQNWDWPETKPAPIYLGEAGFFYDGELTAFNRFYYIYIYEQVLIFVFTRNRLEYADRMFSLWRTPGLDSQRYSVVRIRILLQILSIRQIY